MAETSNLSGLIGKKVSVCIDGSASDYKVLAVDTACRFIKLVYADSDNPAMTWYPLRSIQNIEEL